MAPDKRLKALAPGVERGGKVENAGGVPRVDNATRLRFKYNKQIAANAMKHYEEKYGKDPTSYLLSQPTSLGQAQTE